jgi:hypothetical protein
MKLSREETLKRIESYAKIISGKYNKGLISTEQFELYAEKLNIWFNRSL